MHWLITHRYVSVLASAALLIMIGAFIVSSHAAIAPQPTTDTWGSGIVLDAPVVGMSGQNQNPVTPQTLGGRNYTYISPFGTSTSGSAPAAKNPPQDGLDWTSLEAALSQGAHANSGATPPTSGSIADAYTFMPSGIVSPVNPVRPQTATEKALYSYGQDAGGVIQAYENQHTNQAAILTDFIQDRNDAGKIAAIKQLGADLSAVGDGLAQVSPTPPEIGTAGTNLANAYREIGNKLAEIPDAKSDPDIVQAILIYDAAADRFAKTYVSLALIFPVYGVSFSQGEPGGVFMMPSSGSSL